MILGLYASIFNLETWRQLTDPAGTAYHQFWAPALLFEFFYNSLGVLFSTLLLVLFFKKRAVWPPAYALFLVLFGVGVSLDIYLTMKIPAAAEAGAGALKDLVQIFIAAAVWIPYCFVSKRVKATFRY